MWSTRKYPKYFGMEYGGDFDLLVNKTIFEEKAKTYYENLYGSCKKYDCDIDLPYSKYYIKDYVFDQFGNMMGGSVNLGGTMMQLSEVGNILAGFNASMANITYEDLKDYAMLYAKVGLSNGIDGESADRALYQAGYDIADQMKNGSLTKETLVNYIILGHQNRESIVEMLRYRDSISVICQ